MAQTSLTTNQTTTVTATVATAGATAAVTANVVITALAAPTVAITTCTAAQSVGVAVNCTITPTVSTGGAAIQNLTVNWGDNRGEQPLGGTSATSASHVYTSPGTYTMTAAATDLNSQRGTASISFVLTRVNPTISITTATNSGSVGVPVFFTVTTAPTPPQPITNVTVDFGDGSTRDMGAISSANTLSKSYGAEGTYTVTATVTDQSGGRGNSTTQVAIGRGTAPTITTFDQATGTGIANKTFRVVVSAATGLSLRSVVVTAPGVSDPLYNGTGSGTFATTAIGPNVILTLTVTDSAGNRSTGQLITQ